MILIGLNKKVLKSMEQYSTEHKYIITGNIGSVIGQIMDPFGFKTYGSVLNINENTNRYSGYTDYICMNKKKLKKIKLIQDDFKNKKIKLIQDDFKNKKIKLIAYGDSMNDFYMLSEANVSYVVGSNHKLIDALSKSKSKIIFNII
jgi:phosphoserine phosphatase